jgi:hypothetical protein
MDKQRLHIIFIAGPNRAAILTTTHALLRGAFRKGVSGELTT